ncbi:MAG TPA: glycosyltransferase, partial [Rhizomicrobium sp.]|nr:glycosyltransferase [Rhizomicrobium sp.]
MTTVRDASSYIEDFIRQTGSALEPRFKDYEILIVDNGSRDGTVEKIEQMQKSVKNIQLYCLAAPIRREIDILAGIDQAIGDIVITMDAAYDPPQLIPQMVDEFQLGAEIVYGLRRDRLALRGLYQRAARLFFSLHRSMTKADLPVAASSYRLMSRRVVNSFISVSNRFELFPVITAFTGFRYATLVYDRVARSGVRDRAEYFQAMQRAVRIMLLGSHYPLRLLT